MKSTPLWMRIIFLTLSLLSTASLAMNSLAQVDNNGWIIGNGGDSLRIAFQQSKQAASHIVYKIKKASFNSDTPAHLQDWIIKHRSTLSADILASNHEWVLEEQATCAWTQTQPAHVISFSFPTCRKSIENFSHAVSLLIHESVHHLGIAEEEFADQVAIAIIEAWKSGRIEWIETPKTSAPSGRVQHSAVWTGEDMIIFGGAPDNSYSSNYNSGYKFSPETMEWTPISKVNAPARHGHMAFWTGDSMIIWGGFKIMNGRSTWQNSGAIWSSKTNTWKTLKDPFTPDETDDFTNARIPQTAVWTGEQLLIWGSDDRSGNSIGLIYNLKNSSWATMSQRNAPHRNWGHTAVWTGTYMIVWGGTDRANRKTDSGALYHLEKDEWIPMTTENLPLPTESHTAIWNGSDMIVFGGKDGGSASNITGSGGVYNLEKDQWTSFQSETALGRVGHTGLWNGAELMIFGGRTKRIQTFLNNVNTFNPISQTWQANQGKNSPSPRQLHSSVWTGSSLIIWGGHGDGGKGLSDGGIYYP